MLRNENSIQKMRVSISALLLIFSILLFLVSWTTSDSVQSNFVQCLHNHSQPTIPISEAIYTPANSSFPSVLQAYIKNRRFLTPTTPKPLAIVTAKQESHVSATVICAKNNGLQIKIRSGGHDFEGLSYVSDVPFVILDMFNLQSINIDIANETAWVQAGATLGELYYRIAEKSKVHGFPAGVCPALGTGGHISGGGYGTMMRKYGLSVDNIIDAQLVDVNAKILNRVSMGEDTFWAIRGGGGASFGVILSWKIKLVQVPENVTVFRVQRTLEQGATDIVYQWQQVAHKLDKGLFIRAIPQVKNGTQEGEKTVEVSFNGLFLGQTERLLPLLNDSFPKLSLQRQDCIEMSWVESTVFWAGFPLGTSINVLLDRPQNAQNFAKTKSDYVKQPISRAGLESIWKTMIEAEKIIMQWNPYGGRMDEISTSDTPFPHRRGNIFKIGYFLVWAEEGEETTNNNINLMKTFYEAMGPYVSKFPREAFQNYRDLDIGSNPSNYTSFANAMVYGSKYFKDNFERLVRVKNMVDPGNFFKHEQSIALHASH